MDLLSKLFDGLSKTVGTPAVILVVVAFIVVEFGRAAAALLQTSPPTAMVGIGLFVVGAFVGFVEVLDRRFEVPAGRSFVEGIVVGMVTGLVGGWLYMRELYPGDTAGGAFARTFFITIPVSGIYALTLSLCHPRAKFRWSERVTAITVFATGVMLPVAYFTGKFSETIPRSRYIKFSEIATMVAVFVTLKAAPPLWRAARAWRPFIAQLLVLGGVAAALAWLLTGLFGAVRLSFGLTGQGPLALFGVTTLVFTMSVLYVTATTDNAFTRRVTAREARRGAALSTPASRRPSSPTSAPR